MVVKVGGQTFKKQRSICRVSKYLPAPKLLIGKRKQVTAQWRTPAEARFPGRRKARRREAWRGCESPVAA